MEGISAVMNLWYRGRTGDTQDLMSGVAAMTKVAEVAFANVYPYGPPMPRSSWFLSAWVHEHTRRGLSWTSYPHTTRSRTLLQVRQSSDLRAGFLPKTKFAHLGRKGLAANCLITVLPRALLWILSSLQFVILYPRLRSRLENVGCGTLPTVLSRCKVLRADTYVIR
jgi:hypothetical protein